LPKHAAVAVVVVDFTEAEAEVGAAVDGVVVARQ
jgi:predicted deacylase